MSMGLSARIQDELLEGREPRNKDERDYMDFMGGLCPMAQRPKKWVKCRNCQTEWEVTGWPAPKRLVGSLPLNVPMEITGRFIFLFPNICIPCHDRLEALAKQPKKKQPQPEEKDGERYDPF